MTVIMRNVCMAITKDTSTLVDAAMMAIEIRAARAGGEVGGQRIDPGDHDHRGSNGAANDDQHQRRTDDQRRARAACRSSGRVKRRPTFQPTKA